jgi:GTP-binding protein Era
MILSDTPGIIKPAYEMQASMMNFVKSAFEDADILIYMVEIEQDLKTKRSSIKSFIKYLFCYC